MLRSALFRSGASFGVKVFGALVAFVFYALVARTLEVADAGVVFVGVALVGVVSAIGRLGLDQAFLRRISQAEPGDGVVVSAEIVSAALVSLATSGVLALVLWRSTPYWAGLLGVEAPQHFLLEIFLIGVIPSTAMLLSVAVLNGASRNIPATILQTLLPQGASLLAVSALLLLANQGFVVVSGLHFAGIHVGGLVLAALAGALLTRAQLGWPRWRLMAVRSNSTLRTGALLYAGSLADVVINIAPTLLVSAAAGSEHAARFNIAQRIAGLIFFAFVAVNTVAGPALGRAARAGDLGTAYRRFTRMMVLSIVPAATLAAVISPWLLGFFGRSYVEAQNSLLLLLAAQIVHASFGPVITVLIMADKKREYTICMGIGVGLSLMLIPLLSSSFGATGAALAVLASVLGQKGAAFIFYTRSNVPQRRSE